MFVRAQNSFFSFVRNIMISGEKKYFFEICTFCPSVPEVRITGDSEMHVEAGSSVALKCLVSKGLHRPKYVHWYRDKVRLVNSLRDGVTIVDNVDDVSDAVGRGGGGGDDGRSPDGDVISYWRNPETTVAGDGGAGGGAGYSDRDTVTSYLTISSVTAVNSGNYSCEPDNARPAKINLHVIKGERAIIIVITYHSKINQCDTWIYFHNDKGL